jgi:hypothetical protein
VYRCPSEPSTAIAEQPMSIRIHYLAMRVACPSSLIERMTHASQGMINVILRSETDNLERRPTDGIWSSIWFPSIRATARSFGDLTTTMWRKVGRPPEVCLLTLLEMQGSVLLHVLSENDDSRALSQKRNETPSRERSVHARGERLTCRSEDSAS